jgi:hypothetical protein
MAKDSVTEKMAFTPGPWQTDLAEDREGGISIDSHDYRVATAHRRLGHGVHDGHRQQVANARLIAAAPELLAALRDVTDCLESYKTSKGSALIGRARNAILKAEESTS